MSTNYDNWERLVAAVLRRELLWRICHEQSRSPSLLSSVSSDFSSSFRSTSSFSYSANMKNGLFKSAQPLPFQTVAGIKTNLRSETKESLVLFEDSPYKFGLEELFMAPCFVLGDELVTFSQTYVVRFKEDINVVVKRWRRGNATHEVMKQRFWTIKSLKYDNVVRLWGYFHYGQDGSFGFYDYFHQGSLHTMLHVTKGQIRVNLDWEARVRIELGAAKGLLHIHRQSENFVHGSIKASNIFLNSQEDGCVDIKPDFEFFTFYQLIHAPEVYTSKECSQAGDVYSFGVLLIELVSGRSPLHYNGRHESLADWVVHNARDELTMMLFDKELAKYSLAKQAMWDMFGLALWCVKKKPEERPKMKNVVNMLELIPTTLGL